MGCRGWVVGGLTDGQQENLPLPSLGTTWVLAQGRTANWTYECFGTSLSRFSAFSVKTITSLHNHL